MSESYRAPTRDELRDLLYWGFTTSTGHGERVDEIGFALAVLARWGNQAPQPIPLSERKPRPEDCDGERRVWVSYERPESQATVFWELAPIDQAMEWAPVDSWLPFHALPLPAREAGKG